MEEESFMETFADGSSFTPHKLRREFDHLLTKLSQMAYILGGDYEALLQKKELIDTYTNPIQVENFLCKVADEFDKLDPKDSMVILSICSWDTLDTDEVISDIEWWMSWYMNNYLSKDRLKDVQDFICRQETAWLMNLSN